MTEHLHIRRLGCQPFPPEDRAKIAAFAASIRELAERFFDYEVVTDFFPREEA